MASSVSGPLGTGANQPMVDPGTTALTNSLPPGPISGIAPDPRIVKVRPMTTGEMNMARSLFGDSIDYCKVKVHNEEYLPFGLQDNDTAMTPNGEMYFNPKHFKLDYSTEYDSYKLWFMHEMGHVWQYQLGFGIKMAGIFTNYNDKKVYEYDSTADADKTLPDFNFEQQCELFKDYYAVRFLNIGPLLARKPFLEKVLREFLENPRNERLLPR